MTHLFVWPIVLGGRAAALSADIRAALEFVGDNRISSGDVRFRYRVV